MSRDRSDVLLMCPLPGVLIGEIDALAREAGSDRRAVVRGLIEEALRLRAMERGVNARLANDLGAYVIDFPRPEWAVEIDDIDA